MQKYEQLNGLIKQSSLTIIKFPHLFKPPAPVLNLDILNS